MSSRSLTSKSANYQLERVSDAIDIKSDDVYSHVAGVLYRVFLTLTIQSTRAYFIFVIKLFVWSIVPLTTIVAILFSLAPKHPAFIIICYSAIALIAWTVVKMLSNSFSTEKQGLESTNQVEVEGKKETKAQYKSKSKLFASINTIISTLSVLARDTLRGRIKPKYVLGVFLRVIGLVAFFVLGYLDQIIGEEHLEKYSWLKNGLYDAEYIVFDTIVAKPIMSVFSFLNDVLPVIWNFLV